MIENHKLTPSESNKIIIFQSKINLNVLASKSYFFAEISNGNNSYNFWQYYHSSFYPQDILSIALMGVDMKIDVHGGHVFMDPGLQMNGSFKSC